MLFFVSVFWDEIVEDEARPTVGRGPRPSFTNHDDPATDPDGSRRLIAGLAFATIRLDSQVNFRTKNLFVRLHKIKKVKLEKL